jgi:hypothetical protein
MSQMTPPDNPTLVQIVRYEVDGDLNGVLCHVQWQILGTTTTFWTRNLDWFPNVKARYWWSKDGFKLASKIEA